MEIVIQTLSGNTFNHDAYPIDVYLLYAIIGEQV